MTQSGQSRVLRSIPIEAPVRLDYMYQHGAGVRTQAPQCFPRSDRLRNHRLVDSAGWGHPRAHTALGRVGQFRAGILPDSWFPYCVGVCLGL